ncbi:MAG: VWA domain-containing protein, partial [Nevskiales bacterium]
MRFLPLALFYVLLPAGAQQPPAGEPTVKFQSSTQLVVETVVVKDKGGKPVEGLGAKDFTITEDGVPQAIAFCEYQKLVDDAEPAPAEPPPAPGAPTVIHSQIAAETPGKLQYRDRRLLAIYFDMTAMPVPDQLRAVAAAHKFIGRQMQSPDLVAIIGYTGGALKVMQDFTSDRSLLNQAIDTLIAGEGLGNDETDTDAASVDTGAAFGQDDAEFNIFNTDRQLAALQTAATMLGHLNEKKALIYFASGLRLNGVDNQAQLQATINAAMRANVSFYPIDARGLVASAPLGDATQGSPGGVAMYSGGSALAMVGRMQRTQDTLYT